MDQVYKSTVDSEETRRVELGLRIKAARESTGYSQTDFAKACGWGEKAQSRISKYEDGSNEPSLADLIIMAKVCHTDPRTLAFGPFQGFSMQEIRVAMSYRKSDPRGKLWIEQVCRLAAKTSRK